MSKVEITKERLKELEDNSAKLYALERGGVDNWELYGEALEQYWKDKEFEEKLAEKFEQILEELSDGTFEPSERGAGIAFREESQETAFELFKKVVMER